MDYDMFFKILIFEQKEGFLTKSDNFAWAIAYAWRLIFKMVSFLEYLLFFGAAFFAQNNFKKYYNEFSHVFWHFSFRPKVTIWNGPLDHGHFELAFASWPFFQQVLVLEYLVFFWSGFLHRTTLYDL